MTIFALSLLRDSSSSFPRICGQFGAVKPPTDRERTRHTAAPTVPSHFEKYPGKMIRPLLRPGRSSLSLSLDFLPPSPFASTPSLPPPNFGLPLLPRLSFTGADCSSSPVPVPVSAAYLPSPTIITVSSWRFFFLPRNAMRTGRNRFIVPPHRFGGENSP